MGAWISRKPILGFFLICFVASMLLLGWMLQSFIAIIVLGALIGGIFYPLYRFLTCRWKVRGWLASLVLCLAIFTMLFVPIFFFVGSLAQQAFGLYQMARDAVISDRINAVLQETQVLDKANAILDKFHIQLTGEEFKRGATEIIRYVASFLYEQSKAIASNTLAFVVNFFLMLLVIFFLLIDGKRLLSFLVDLSPLPGEQEALLIQKFKDMAGAILIGNGITGLAHGVLGGLVLRLAGFHSTFLWGVVVGLLAFLPIVGIGLLMVPTALYLYLTDRETAAVFLMIYYLLANVVESILKPKLVGDRVKIHPLLVFFVIIGGMKVFGILGIVYGPLIATAFLTLAEIYRTNYRQLLESDGDGSDPQIFAEVKKE